MNEVISVRNLTKNYTLYRKPIDRLKRFFLKNIKYDIIHALDNISFSLHQGETLGIVGENGAGKSTLLKLLSGVISPTYGEISVSSTVLSILELGVGLHPEFTGRENIFFYGDIIGFDRDFLKGKVAEIEDFSELGPFMDVPIKTYSSGMLMRLAFSIITSFEPEIIILDEVLAVGDIHFQRKSLQRILNFKHKGKTIIFCSHDTYHTRMICDRALWLKDGRIEAFDDAEKVVTEYEIYQMKKERQQDFPEPANANVPVIIKNVNIKSGIAVKRGEDICVEVETIARDEDVSYHMSVSLKLKEGRGVFATGSQLNGNLLKGSRKVFVTFIEPPLLGGSYYVHVRLWDETGLILYHNMASYPFEILKEGTEFGICFLENKWEIQ